MNNNGIVHSFGCGLRRSSLYFVTSRSETEVTKGQQVAYYCGKTLRNITSTVADLSIASLETTIVVAYEMAKLAKDIAIVFASSVLDATYAAAKFTVKAAQTTAKFAVKTAKCTANLAIRATHVTAKALVKGVMISHYISESLVDVIMQAFQIFFATFEWMAVKAECLIKDVKASETKTLKFHVTYSPSHAMRLGREILTQKSYEKVANYLGWQDQSGRANDLWKLFSQYLYRI